ncbi:MAG: AI-2E family transporter, partial [Bacteroidetes bacterium]|nr:AI-2E family transporter [Bacteroidota bacterium]
MRMKGFSNDSVKQFYFLAVLTILAGILGYMLRDYISSFLGAATLYIVFRQPLHYLTEQRRWHKALAVSALIVVSMIVVLIPVGLLSFMLSSKAQYLVEHYAEFLDIVKGWNERLSAGYGVNLISQESISKVTTAGADFIPVLLSATLSSFTQIAVLYFLLYFMMMEGRSMERRVLQYSP